MPITDPEKRRILIEEGFDPDLIDEGPSGFQEESQNPVTKPTPSVIQTGKTSKLGAFARSAVEEILPTAGGTGLALTAAKVLPGYAKLAALPLAAGGAMGVKALQDPLLKTVGGEEFYNRWQEQRAADYAEHPWLSRLGAFVPQLTLMRPSSIPFKEAGRGLVKATEPGSSILSKIKSGQVTGNELGSIANVGMGGGLGLGFEGINILRKDEPLDITDIGNLAISTLGGAALNQPYGPISRGIGLIPTHESLASTVPTVKQQRISGPNIAEEAPTPPILPTTREPLTLSPEQPIEGGIVRDLEYRKALLLERRKALQEQSAELAKLEANQELAQIGVENKMIAAANKQREHELTTTRKELELEQEKLLAEEAAALTQAEVKREVPGPYYSEATLGKVPAKAEREVGGTLPTRMPEEGKPLPTAEEITPAIGPTKPVPGIPTEGKVTADWYKAPKFEPLKISTGRKKKAPVVEKPVEPIAPGETPEQIKARLLATETKPTAETYTGEQKPTTEIKYTTPEQQADIRAELEQGQAEGRYQEGSRMLAQEQQEAASVPIPKALADWFKTRYAAWRNVHVDDSGRIINPKTGEEIPGQAVLRQGLQEALVKINPNKAYSDTWAHEPFHIFLHDMLNGPSVSDRKLAQRILSEIEKLPEYRDWVSGRNPKYQNTPEEFLAEHTGIDFMRRLSSRSELLNLMSDAWHNIKLKWGLGKATMADYRRLMSSRMLYDPSFLESRGRMGATGKPPVIGGERQYGKEMQEGQETLVPRPTAEFEGPSARGEAPPLERTGVPVGEEERAGYLYQEGTRDRVTEVREGLGVNEQEANNLLAAKTIPEAREILRDIFNSRNLKRKPGEGGHNKALDAAYNNALDYLVKDVLKLPEEAPIAAKFSEMRRVTEEAKPEAPKAVQRELPLGGDAAKFEEMRRATEGERYQEGSRRTTEQQIADLLRDPKDTPIPTDSRTMQSWEYNIPIMAARYDKVATANPGKTGKLVRDNLVKFEAEADRLWGEFTNPIIDLYRKSNLSPESIMRVTRWLYAKDAGMPEPFRLNAREQKLADDRTKLIRLPKRIQQELKMEVRHGSVYRTAGMKPEGYMENMLSPKVAEELTQRSDSALSNHYKKLWQDHAVEQGYGAEEAKKMIDDYVRALGMMEGSSADIEFGALRKAEGIGLPWELIDQNPVSSIMRYGRRAARDIAFFKYIQSQPDMQVALGLKDQYGKRPNPTDYPDIQYIGGNRATQQALRSVFSVSDRRFHPAIVVANKVAANLFMGPMTAAKNLVNVPVFATPYMTVAQHRHLIGAFSHMSEAADRAFKNNAIRPDFTMFDVAGPHDVVLNGVEQVLSTGADYARRYQLRDWSNKMEGLYAYTLGEMLATENFAAAKNGDAFAIKFLKKFGDTVDGGVEQYFKIGKQITPEVLGKIAKRFTDRVRGTYSAEGLPSWAMEGNVAPFVQLSRFVLEKANVIWQDVIMPAKSGDIAPLLKYTVGSLITGAAMNELVKAMTNRKGIDPEIKELKAGDAGTMQYIGKIAGLMQLSTFLGIYGDFAKMGINALQGKKTINNPFSFPAYQMTESAFKSAGDAIEAVNQGEPILDTLGRMLLEFGRATSQSYRLAENWLAPELTKRKEAFRDLAVYEEITQQKNREFSSDYNPLEGATYRGYKQAKTSEEARDKLSGVVDMMLERASKNGRLDPIALKRELGKVVRNQYRTMPSPDTSPDEFEQYYNYLVQTLGEDAAKERVRDFVNQRTLNRAKTEAIKARLLERL